MFFVFAQAALLRSGGQSAADAAALAAAQEARDRLFDDLLTAIGDGDDLRDILAADGLDVRAACSAAERLAGRNGATVQDCGVLGDRAGFRVRVETDEAIGESVVPGTEGRRAESSASAVIEGLCSAPDDPPDEEEPPPDEGEDGGSDGGEDGGGGQEDDEDDRPPVELDCEDERWTVDPDDPDDADTGPEARDLFRVRLED